MQKNAIALLLALFLCTISNVDAAQVLFTPSLFVSEEYTDNLYLDPEDEESDYITAIGLDLTGQILWRTAGFEISYNPSYNAYAENEDLDYWRQQASVSVWKIFAQNTRLEVSDTFLRTNDPTDRSAITEEDGQAPASDIDADRNRRGRDEYDTNVAEVRLTHQFGADDNIYAAYQHATLREVDPLNEEDVDQSNPDEVADFEDIDDNDIITYSIGGVYYFTQAWGMELDGFYATSEYDDVDVSDREEYNGNIRFLGRFSRALSGYVNYQYTILEYELEDSDDFTVSAPSVGIRYEFRDSARIDIGIGFYAQDFDNGEDQEGYFITADAFKQWIFRNSFFGVSANSGYSIDDDGTEDNGLSIYYEAGVQAGYNFTSRLTGTVSGSYRNDDYPNETPERTEDTIGAGLALDWQALQWMNIRLSYDHTDVSSDIEADEYTENRALLTIRLTPTRPFRIN